MRALRATVRLQLHAGFDFAAAQAQVDYYAALGVSHYYLSPILASRPGSPHGYDGIDPTRVDPELGGEAGLEQLVAALHAREMGIIADIVPNHLAVGADNPWWQDVLALGRESRYAGCFDIDWAQPGCDGKLLLPFLGDRYTEVLSRGELVLSWAASRQRFEVVYHDHRFPIAPDQMAEVIDAEVPASGLREDDPRIRTALLRHDASHTEGRARLHALLERQAYRLAHWRTANDALNWRRFFDITELAGVRVEDESVFDLSHVYLLSLVERGWIDGLRIDHIDGLADPKGYCRRLRARLDGIAAQRRDGDSLPIFVEKILGGHEALHDDWGVDGTTGYEFLDLVSGVQHDPAGQTPLQALWQSVSGRPADFAVEIARARREMIAGPLTAEFERAVAAIAVLAMSQPATREFSVPAIRRVLGALAVGYPVYRGYADRHGRPAADEGDFQVALRRAEAALSAADAAWLPTLDDWLGARAPEVVEAPESDWRLTAIVRFQQLTSPLAAKAVEDTAGYRSAVLLSRNDVGCEGDTFAYSISRLHRANRDRLAHFPLSLLTTATHDHKRGEDVRARLAAISEYADELAPQLRDWASDGRLHDAPERPSGGDRLMLLQLLLAAWPIGLRRDDREGLETFAERLVAWQRKAMREAKLASHWLAPDAAYEQAGEDAVRRALAGDELTHALAGRAAWLDLPGAINGLTQTVLRLCAPGVPDLYQGTEFWDLSLVDPDNRRPVDMAARREALSQAESPAAAWRHWRDGGVKQAVIKRLLTLRRDHTDLFRAGDYLALEARGSRAQHVIAFARCWQDLVMIVVAPRFSRGLLGAEPEVIADESAAGQLDWGDTVIDLAGLHDAAGMSAGELEGWLTDDAWTMTGGELSLSRHLARFPCGVWVTRR
ncbi:malto-oligosyltrehalose synthase [Salinicola avicenniae]|uniref:malto-oligosyltrehalose synthase n=1 Tax=Salinicola avicenniae TaxID=2916836 RepID=UPI0020731EE9|nr:MULTISPECIES: malto-oligosyltrehalose synthase [unclassified Salinicola]